ncbi:Halotolerance protein 9 [Pleurostoma richardsiae]|uniref:Halotolerance protein 9 n=1 Tax=Pleurostoma richardsiae TaxID=41990 RepID=A0AA38W0J1_9PEZI|nr:Halotolerance protein 9 [Pleurostoma richardsiae]
MSYQYPPPPPNGAEMDMQPAGYMSNYSVPPPASSAMDMRQSPDQNAMKLERRDSLSKSLQLKRSLSTPNVRPQQPQALSAQNPVADHLNQSLSGDKRRNKLGYHRTSVACTHCRRRKIRCIPRANDVHGRCENCIRLKKDCSFQPVDQPPSLADTRQKSSSSRASVGPNMVASASSSPAMPSGHPSDMHAQQVYPQLGMPSMAPPSMKLPGSDSFGSESKMPAGASARAFSEYGAPAGMTNWMAPDSGPGSASSAKPGDLSATWRSYPHESPITPAFSPFTPHAPPPHSGTWTTTAITAEPSTRDDMSAWSSYPPPQSRSLSFGAESLASAHQQAYPPIAQLTAATTTQPTRGGGYDRRQSGDMYSAPPMATTIPGAESLEHAGVSLSAGGVPPASYATWQQQQPHQPQPQPQQTYSYAKPSESYAGWYGEGQPQAEHATPDAAGMYYTGR